MSKKKQLSKKKSKKIQRKKVLPEFDKYYYYSAAVQSAENDVQFFKTTYQNLRKTNATTMREDFCGTFMLSCEWVKLDPKHKSIGVDLDPEPLQYGQEKYLSALTSEQQARLSLNSNDVLAENLPHCDIACALNFSYFIFKQRTQMKKYFRNVLESLNHNGIFIMDIFGGSKCGEASEEETEHEDFSYFWDQTNFDPVSNHAQFYIHFKRKGEKKREKVFSYDWRLWSIPELRELLHEVGFAETVVYWEGTDKNGEGDGEFNPCAVGEECESWIAYIIAKK